MLEYIYTLKISNVQTKKITRISARLFRIITKLLNCQKMNLPHETGKFTKEGCAARNVDSDKAESAMI